MDLPEIPPIHGVVESILYVDDVPRSVEFYRHVLGFVPLKGDGDRFQAFDAGGKGVLLLLKRGGTLVPVAGRGGMIPPVPAQGGMIPPHDGNGPYHIAFGIDPEAYDSWSKRLRDLGIAIES